MNSGKYFSNNLNLEIGTIRLSAEHLDLLNSMDQSEDMDAKFIVYLLTILFDKSELIAGSFGGTKSNFNGKSHNQLNEKKIKFIEGIMSNNEKKLFNRVRWYFIANWK